MIKNLLEKFKKVGIKEALSDYGFRLNDVVKIKDVEHYGEIGTIIDWSDELRQATVETSFGGRFEVHIDDIEIIE